MATIDRTKIQPDLRVGSVGLISDTSTASTEDVADRLNALIYQLREAGILEE